MRILLITAFFYFFGVSTVFLANFLEIELFFSYYLIGVLVSLILVITYVILSDKKIKINHPLQTLITIVAWSLGSWVTAVYGIYELLVDLKGRINKKKGEI